MKKNYSLIIVVLVVMMAIISIATYAYFATGILNVTNVANLNVVTERNNMVFDTLGGEMTLNVTAANMAESLSGNVAAENNTTLTVNFTPNTEYSMVCTYDIVYEWTSSDKYTAHTSGVSSNEFTIQGTLASNAHVSQGTNSISSETDLSTLTYTNYAATVVSGAQIDGTGNTMSTAVWTLSSKFYNVGADQSTLSGKTYAGRFKVSNVSCSAGVITRYYWNDNFAAIWNDGIEMFEPSYATGVMPTGSGLRGTYGSRELLATAYDQANGANSFADNPVYIKTTNGVHEICLYYNSHEYCMLPNYWTGTIGVDNATEGTNTMNKLKTDMANALGVQEAYLSCYANSGYAYCYVSDFSCGAASDGYVYCNVRVGTCCVYGGGAAGCNEWYYP